MFVYALGVFAIVSCFNANAPAKEDAEQIQSLPASSNQMSSLRDENVARNNTLSNGVDVSNSGIWVSGQASIEIKPDIAILRVGVETEGLNTKEALNNNSKYADAVLNYLKQNQVSSDDIQTTNINISPRYEYPEITGPSSTVRKQVLVGYRVYNSVVIKVRDIDNLGELIDGVTEVGRDSIRVNGIEFARDDIEPFMDDLRKDAVENAIDKATQFAKYSGVSLGGLTRLSESPVSSYSRGDMFETRAFASSASISTPIQEGTLKYTLDVQAGFSIE
jgi:hypothetical protein